MRGIKTKTSGKWKRATLSVILILIFGFLLNSVMGVYAKKREAEKTLSRMQNQVEELKMREVFLKKHLEQLETEEGLKFEIRKKMNVAEAGESVAIIVEEESIDRPKPIQESTWQKIIFFFHQII